ncbi:MULTISPECIES: lysis system i-spanin subunit Rz [unclassified Pseudomonas]|uniref:lysis system i-spanin subunit Rz n=1 Tax=unclassified Pseudomonas TaxID=196821 RepID=UPI000C8861B0|nr:MULTISPECIES: lysis system i-spanin subunit Rz [unclassified Pseudomonas]PMX24928.1 lysis protein [Pseudomonas sp. GW460-12]PMX36994.1 lysis protein [Pseudomonas sp. MPR-R2A4]PMX43390.1 lysis protein [Pseudomonas sp. MPR-R2A7]PMX53208.1 lysis protein [Pseudomonas sp. MPR-R2A6]PMX93514.1 lysis protein [Pseudomonas sp. MPR-R2A3]
MTPMQILVTVLMAMVISAAGTWQVQSWRLGRELAEQAGLHHADLAAITNAAATRARAEQDKRMTTEHQLAIQDQKHIQELSDAQHTQAVLRDRLATSDVRLSVLLAEEPASVCSVSSTASAVGVVHAARRAHLDSAHAQRIIGITDAGDQGLIALKACQDYVKEVCAPN